MTSWCADSAVASLALPTTASVPVALAERRASLIAVTAGVTNRPSSTDRRYGPAYKSRKY
jgi:hypothetical protein